MVIIYRGGEVNNRPPLATDTEMNNCYLVYTKTEYNRVLEKKRNDKWKPKGNLLVFVMVPFFFPLNFGILRCLFIYLFLSAATLQATNDGNYNFCTGAVKSFLAVFMALYAHGGEGTMPSRRESVLFRVNLW